MNQRKNWVFFLEIIGLAMMLIPFIFLLVITLNYLIDMKEFLFDFLLPAEYSFIILPGALIITLIAMKTKNHFKEKGILFAVSIVTLLIVMIIPGLVGFGQDASLAKGFWFVFTIVSTVIYDVSSLCLCIYSLLILRI